MKRKLIDLNFDLPTTPESVKKRQSLHTPPISPSAVDESSVIQDYVHRWVSNLVQETSDPKESAETSFDDGQCDSDTSDMVSQTGSTSARSQSQSQSQSQFRSRSSSPSKIKRAGYRSVVLPSANIHVDVDVAETVRQNLLPRSLKPLTEEKVETAALGLYQGARAINQETAHEEEWQQLFVSVVGLLLQESDGLLVQKAKKTWLPELVPDAYVPDTSIPNAQRKRHASSSFDQCRQPPATPATASTIMPPPTAQSNLKHPFTNITLIPIPTASTSTTTVFRRADDHVQPSRPEPDIVIGLRDTDTAWRDAYTSTAILHQLQLDALSLPQDSLRGLISEPFVAAPSGLRFPFVCFELKADRGSSADAINQAAVSGACSLQILQALQRRSQPGNEEEMEHHVVVGDGIVSSGETVMQDSIPPTAPATVPANEFNLRVFSLTTTGSKVEIWAHIPPAPIDPGLSSSPSPNQNPYGAFLTGWDMVYLASYRVSSRKDAAACAKVLADIIAWGRHELREWVVGRLLMGG